MKRPALILICLLLQACSATTKELGNSLWDSLFGTPGVQLTDDDIQNMPYASQYMQLNGGPQLFVVLAFAEDGQQKWVTQDQATLVTQHGRLVKTLLGGVLFVRLPGPSAFGEHDTCGDFIPADVVLNAPPDPVVPLDGSGAVHVG